MKRQLPAGLSRAIVLLRQMVAPARCIQCLKEGSWHCMACQKSWWSGDLSCIVCKSFQRQGITCIECQKETPLRGLLSAGSYQSERLRRGIGWLKFSSVRSVADALAFLALPQLRHIAPLPQLQRSAVLVPVPLHASRQRDRGFNQAEEIARALSNYTDIPWLSALRRTRATVRQTSLPMGLRTANMAEAFACNKPPDKALVDASTIIVVDDVTTSGSTLAAAAQALPMADSQRAWGLVIARG